MHSPDVIKRFSTLDDGKFMYPDVTCTNKIHRYSNRCHSGSKDHQPYDYVMKVILLGDQGVGKTSFIKALHVHPDVAKVPCHCSREHSSDHLELEINTVAGKTALVTLCDTGGQERYRSLTSSYYRGSHGVIVMFDVNHSKSMANVEMWLSDLDAYLSTASCTRVLLGTNCTSPKRMVSAQDARKYAENRSLAYMETDSGQFYNIVESIQLVVERIAKDITIPAFSSSVIKPSWNSQNTQEKKKYTCFC